MNVFYNHLHFRSADPDDSAKFYCDNFGAEIVAERPLSNTKSIELSLNGTYLMTISGRAQGEDPVAGSTEPRYGLDHLGFQTDDIMTLAATLKSNSVHFNCDPWVMPSGSAVAFIVAPDEVSVEIIQRPAAGEEKVVLAG